MLFLVLSHLLFVLFVLVFELIHLLIMGYETFRKQFVQEMHMSPDAYRQQKRMQTAQTMLLEGQSVKSIAQSLGYSDTYAFSKQFKRYFGYAPTHFSNQLR